MAFRSNIFRLSMMVALVAGIIAVGQGCSRKDDSAKKSDASAQPAGPTTQYVLRGVLEQLPRAGGQDHEIYVHHEPIADFRNDQGVVTGMPEMSMPFTVDPSVSLGNLVAGDKVQLTWQIRWQPQVQAMVTAIEKLPAGTEMNFRPLPGEPSTQPMPTTMQMPDGMKMP